MLRSDNADRRLTPLGRQLGLVDDRRWRLFQVGGCLTGRPAWPGLLQLPARLPVLAPTAARLRPTSRRPHPPRALQEKQARIDGERQRLEAVRVPAEHPLVAAAEAVSGQKVPPVVTLADLLRRPHVHYRLLREHGVGAQPLDLVAAEAAAAAASSGSEGVAASQQPPEAQAAAAADAQQQQQQRQPVGISTPPGLLTAAEAEATEIDIK